MPAVIEVIDRVWDTFIRRPGLLMGGVAVGTVAVDAVVKTAAVALVRDGHCIPPTSRNVAVCVVRSPGVVSSPTAAVAYGLVVAAVLLAVAVWCALRLRSPTWAVALGLVTGGLAGNLVDRVFRGPAPFTGRVVDVFSVGIDINVADGAVVLGVVAMLWFLRSSRRIDGMLRPVSEPDRRDAAADEELDPDDEKVALAHRPKFPARKWDPMPGTPRHLGPAADGDDDDSLIDEDDRPLTTRPKYPAAKWDRD